MKRLIGATLVASVAPIVSKPTLPPFYATVAETARGAATRLLEYVSRRADMVDYNPASRNGHM